MMSGTGVHHLQSSGHGHPGTEAGYYFPALTGLRAIAAYMVFVYHYNPFHGALYFYCKQWNAGVTIFFVLSGFLITHRYYNSRPLRLKQYFVARLARIYPLYFLLTTLTFLYDYFQPGHANSRFFWLYLLNISMLKGLFELYKFTGVSQGWSLSVEELFYGIAPLCFLLIRRRHYWLWLLPVCIFFTGMALTAFFRAHPFYNLLDNYLFTINTTFFGRCTEFFIGMWLAIALAKGRLPFKARHLTYVSIPLIALCIVLMAIARGVAGYGLETPVGIAVNSLLLPICIIMLLQGLITEDTPVRRILSGKLLQVLGKSSYAFYLIHVGLLAQLPAKTQSLPLIYLILTGASLLLWKFAEVPLNNLIRNRLSGRRGGAVAMPENGV